jgi:hypothetical protein
VEGKEQQIPQHSEVFGSHYNNLMGSITR